MKFFSVSCLLSLFSVFALCSPSFSEGENVLELAEKADMAICFNEDVYIDIGISRQINGKREPILFAQEHLVDFLKNQRRKEILVASFPQDLNSKSKSEARKFLHSLKFKRVVECTISSDKIFSARENARRDFPETETDSKYLRTRTVTAEGTPDRFDIGFGFDDKSSIRYGKHPHVVWRPIKLDREELLAFLKQDSQKNILEVLWSKWVRADEELLKNMANVSNFSATKFKTSSAFLPGEPVELDHYYNKFLSRADMVLCFSGPNEIDIGVASMRNGKRIPKLFTQDELTEFFDKETRKELVIAFISKSAAEKEDIDRFLTNLRYRQVIKRVGIPENVYSIRAHWDRQFPSDKESRIEFDRVRQMRIEGPDVFSIRLGIKELNEPSQLFLNPTEHTIFLTKDELGEFLKQDTQKQVLRIHEPKYEVGIDERAFEAFVKKCGFPFAEFVPDVSMFQVMPIVGPYNINRTPANAAD